MTQCGFSDFGDEYKLMGLSAHGKFEKKFERLNEIVTFSEKKLYELNLKYFNHHKSQLDYKWNNTKPRIGQLFNKNELEDLLKISQNKNKNKFINYSGLAFMTQHIYEKILFSLLKKYHIFQKISF